MKTDQSYHKPEGNACVPAEMLWDYLEGKLSAKQQHQVEAHLLDCPMCSDALEGFQQSGNRVKVTQLNEDIVKRVTYRSNWYLTAAAASVVLVAAFGLLWWGLDNKTTPIDNVAQESFEIKKQETISSATPEERGPGNPQPDLNRPSSDGEISLNQAPFSSTQTDPQEISRSFSATSQDTYYTNAATATDPNIITAGEQESVNQNQNYKEEDKIDYFDVTTNGTGNASGATSPTTTSPASPAPSPPAVAKPSPGYRSTNNSKAAKNKQAPSAAEANTKKASLAEGMQYYNTSNYTEAIKVFKDVISDDASNQEAHYYLGMSYKGNGDKFKAIDELAKVGPTCLYYEDALWNRSLLLIEAGRKEEAKPLLQKLVDSKGKYAGMAGEKLLGL